MVVICILPAIGTFFLALEKIIVTARSMHFYDFLDRAGLFIININTILSIYFMKLITLNIEGSRHLDKFIPFIKKGNPDVVCLQEVFECDFDLIKKSLEMEGELFCTTTKIDKNSDQQNGPQGVAILTKLQNNGIKSYYYFGEGTIPIYVDTYNVDKVLVYTTIEYRGKSYNISTTHFCWTPDGKADNHQREGLKSLMKFDFSDFILCGDFNAARGEETYTFLSKFFKDNLPLDIKSTIDPILHRKKGLQLCVDSVFSKSCYNVEVKVVEGVSDHKALVANIVRLN